ncbi:MAG: glyoxalase, partial [Thalassospira sp.]|nr:glyoxalase [Thalassospira sp.]
WIDFDFFGHQLSAHVRPEAGQNKGAGDVDGDAVPIPHFGAVLEWEKWHKLADKLKAANVKFLLEPKIRFKGELGEQGTFFVEDPAGNGLEFKTFRDPAMIFAH